MNWIASLGAGILVLLFMIIGFLIWGLVVVVLVAWAGLLWWVGLLLFFVPLGFFILGMFL